MEVLHRLGCRLMQGFLFSRPLPPAEMEAWREQTLLARQATWIVERGEEGVDDETAELAGGADDDDELVVFHDL